MGPLVASQAAAALMVLSIQQVKEVQRAVVKKRHAVAGEIWILGSKVLQHE
jgi:hypothetical protein